MSVNQKFHIQSLTSCLLSNELPKVSYESSKVIHSPQTSEGLGGQESSITFSLEHICLSQIKRLHVVCVGGTERINSTGGMEPERD